METEITNPSHGVDFHSIVVLIVSTIVLGFLFTWDFLVYSTTWTLRSLVGVYIGVHLCCFLAGFLSTDDAASTTTASFRWSRQSKLSKKLKEYAKAASVFGISVVFFYLLPILLGVPLLSQCLETLQFSFFLSSLLTFPGILTWGGDEIKWLRIVFGTGGQSKWECVWLRSCCFCLCGAWLGAFAIPLDWDRPWQLWPVSSTYGALLGYSLGLAYNLQRHRTNNQQRKFV